MNTFTTGQQLSARSICDHDCVFEGQVLKRTAKTVTINTRMKGVSRCKVHNDEQGNEFIFPYGRYSMAPIFRA
ncbi:MAG: hypothetical protein IME93_03125 [Proteobacteria bacterium]|nr:hypothetical protein [Pseudomonadota bacterium]